MNGKAVMYNTYDFRTLYNTSDYRTLIANSAPSCSNMAQTKTKRTGRNIPHCSLCESFQCSLPTDHKESDKCLCHCANCGSNRHHMSFCYGLKFCNLCGEAGHNPYRCWKYCTVQKWVARAKQLDRCVSCLQPWKPSKLHGFCSHCNGIHIDKSLPSYSQEQNSRHTKESQTEDNYLVQECHKELQEGKNIIEKQRMQIEDLNSRLSSLEDKLESSKATIDDLEWRLQNITKEKEQELQKANRLDLLCKEKEMDLRKLSEQIGRKDFELEQHRKTSAQPSLTIPATAQQPCPTPTSNSLEHVKETNSIKATLTDIQDQQQKLSLIVNHLYNKIKTQDMNWLSYSSFNPCMGPYDTGQCFN